MLTSKKIAVDVKKHDVVTNVKNPSQDVTSAAGNRLIQPEYRDKVGIALPIEGDTGSHFPEGLMYRLYVPPLQKPRQVSFLCDLQTNQVNTNKIPVAF